MILSTHWDARMFFAAKLQSRLGELYVWGGDDESEGGFDCSGLVSAALTDVAKLWPAVFDGGRRTASGLHAYYRQRGCPGLATVGELRPGCLVFYRVPGQPIHHVAAHLLRLPDGTPMGIEAGGGGSSSATLAGALRRSGSVRWTDSHYHGDGVTWVALDPFGLLPEVPTRTPVA